MGPLFSETTEVVTLGIPGHNLGNESEVLRNSSFLGFLEEICG